MSEQGCVPCALILGENHLLYSVCRPLGVLVARRQHLRLSDLVWNGDDTLCAGDVETPILSGEAFSGTRCQDGRGDLQALVATQGDTRKRLGGREAILLIECFNNMDVGVA